MMHYRLAGHLSFISIFTVSLLVPSMAANAFAPSTANKLVPHRAVYEMTLDKARSGSGITGILGRMVFEFTGSQCEGFTLNMRLVTNVTDRQGVSALTDMRTSSWEQGDGKRFRFNSSQYRNQKLGEVTTGDASRKSNHNDISVVLKKPSKSKHKLPGDILFPTQHSLKLLSAAHKGETIVQANIYDGSDKGSKYFFTSAYIGKAVSPGPDKSFKSIKNAKPLDNLVSWPVSISYFETDKPAGEALPSYELGFRLYGNGVSRKLQIDYGDFVIRGELSKLEFLQDSKCK